MKHTHFQWDKDGEIRYDENHQQIDKTPPVTTSTDAMNTEEGDAITKMILDKTKIKA